MVDVNGVAVSGVVDGLLDRGVVAWSAASDVEPCGERCVLRCCCHPHGRNCKAGCQK